MNAVTKHEFFVYSGFYSYEVVDHQEGELVLFHRFTVYKWKYMGPLKEAKLVDQDNEVYAKTKLAAVKVFKEKTKRRE